MLFLLFLLLRAVIKMGQCNSKLAKLRKIEKVIEAENKAEEAAMGQRNIEYQKVIKVLAIAWWFNRISNCAGRDFPIPAKNTLPPIEIDKVVELYLRNIKI